VQIENLWVAVGLTALEVCEFAAVEGQSETVRLISVEYARYAGPPQDSRALRHGGQISQATYSATAIKDVPFIS
jgi:hypothetical protein